VAVLIYLVHRFAIAFAAIAEVCALLAHAVSLTARFAAICSVLGSVFMSTGAARLARVVSWWCFTT